MNEEALTHGSGGGGAGCRAKIKKIPLSRIERFQRFDVTNCGKVQFCSNMPSSEKLVSVDNNK